MAKEASLDGAVDNRETPPEPPTSSSEPVSLVKADRTPAGDPAAGDPAAVDPANWAPPRLSPRRAFAFADLKSAAKVALALSAGGILAGLLWAVVAPHATVLSTADGAVYAGYQSEQFIGADIVFLVIVAVIGVAAGVAAWLWRSTRGPWMAIGLTVGGLAGALIAAYVGGEIGAGEYREVINGGGPAGQTVTAPVTLRAGGFMLVEPLLALMVYAVTAGWSRYLDLRRGDFTVPPEVWAFHGLTDPDAPKPAKDKPAKDKRAGDKPAKDARDDVPTTTAASPPAGPDRVSSG